MATDFVERCDAIEECYEFMLAYAAQGVAGDSGNESSGQLRLLLDEREIIGEPAVAKPLVRQEIWNNLLTQFELGAAPGKSFKQQ